MKEVVEVRIGDGVASLGPIEDWLPAGGKQGVDAAMEESASVMIQNKVATNLGQSLEPIPLKVP